MLRLFIALCLIISLSLFFPPLLSQAATADTSITVTVCGDSIIEGNEDCEGSDLNNQTCQTLGYDSGTLACSANCTFDTSGCSSVSETPPSPGGGGGGGGGPIPITTKVIIQGKAYSDAPLTILKDGQVIVATKADSEADFKVVLSTITPGVYTFGVFAEDKEGEKSITFSFTVNVAAGTITTISGIFIPPTIGLNKRTLARGETLDIYGQTAPESDVDIYINSDEEIIEKTKANQIGVWALLLDTGLLTAGTHFARAKAMANGLTSGFSHALSFYLGVGAETGICPRTDLNGDGRTNLIDFSILMYWWNQANECADQNNNGIVDLADFSIMMYWWTG